MLADLLLLMCGSAYLQTVDVTRNEDFEVHAHSVAMMEGGPLVVLVTLEYKGERDVEIATHNFFKNSYISPGGEWKFRPIVRGIIGPLHGSKKLSPGDKWSEVHYMHHCWEDIPAGKVVLGVCWPIREPGRGGKEIARPFTKLELDIPLAAKERVRALRQRLEEELSKAKGEDRQQVIDYIRYTNHAGLVPVVWRLIESFPADSPVLDFLPMVYASGEDKGTVNRRLVKLACDRNYPCLDNLFWYWRRERVALSTEEIAPLLRSEDVWTRTLTCVTFPNQCGKEWTERLLHDLRELQKPLPKRLFTRLLSDLDDDDFSVRERATRELQQHGERVRAQLAKALQGNPTPEVKARVQRVLDDIAKGPPPIIRTTLWLLWNADHPQAQTILRLLAEGPADWWATKESKEVLGRLEKQRR